MSLTLCSKLSVYFVQLTDLLCYQIQLWLELVTDDLVSCHLSDTFSDGTYAAPLSSLAHTLTLWLWCHSTSKSDLKENTHVS